MCAERRLTGAFDNNTFLCLFFDLRSRGEGKCIWSTSTEVTAFAVSSAQAMHKYGVKMIHVNVHSLP